GRCASTITSRTQPLAAARAPGGDHLAASLGRHAGAKTMSALAHQLARLVGPLHGWFSAGTRSLRSPAGGEGREGALPLEAPMGSPLEIPRLIGEAALGRQCDRRDVIRPLPGCSGHAAKACDRASK